MSLTSHPTTAGRSDGAEGPRKIGPADGKRVDIGSAGVRFLAWSADTGGGFALVEHPIPPRGLVAPLHKHAREDEYSFVLEGRMGAVLGADVVHAEAGDLVFKPRDQWHTFWNAGDGPCRILEIISPGGFERCFDEMAAALAAPTFAPQQMAELASRYGIELQPESIPLLCAAHGLTHPLLATRT